MEELKNARDQLHVIVQNMAIFDWSNGRWIYAGHGTVPDGNHMITMRDSLGGHLIRQNSKEAWKG